MPSYGNEIAPRDLTQTTTMPFGGGVIELEFYINRLTGEAIPVNLNGHGDDATDAEITNYRNAAELCSYLAAWDLTGPVVGNDGTVYVETATDPVPIDPDIVAHIALPFRNAITQHILGIAFPNQPTSIRSRRR